MFSCTHSCCRIPVHLFLNFIINFWWDSKQIPYICSVNEPLHAVNQHTLCFSVHVTFPRVVLIEGTTGDVRPANKWAHIILDSFVVSQKTREWRCSAANLRLNEGCREEGLELWMCSRWTEGKPLEDKWETKSNVRVDIRQPQSKRSNHLNDVRSNWEKYQSAQWRASHGLQHTVRTVLLVCVQR